MDFGDPEPPVQKVFSHLVPVCHGDSDCQHLSLLGVSRQGGALSGC